MKGKCDLIKCQICNQEMSFGRIKRHISSNHKEITVDQYVRNYWSTLPLHQPCEVCNNKIVYKYKTCSKECRSKLEHSHKGKSKPKGFMSEEHKEKISKSMMGKSGGFKGYKHTEIFKNKKSNDLKDKKIHLGCKHSVETKKIMSKKRKEYYLLGNEPWTKNNSHSTETIKKIFQKRPMNRLEKFVASILDENNIKYIYQFFLKTENGICKSYDFKIKNVNLLIEIDGNYWHGGPGVEKHFYKLDEVKINDKIKNQLASENGYSLIRIWESDIYNQPNILIQKIKELIK
jgi:very-short-patch-repair endonuclease/predicted nucleic acid-binding Zn ribbon protein